jgi:hypothetical protein
VHGPTRDDGVVTSTEPEQSAAPSGGAGRPPRRQSVSGIVLTMLVVGGFALGLWALVPRTSGIPQPAVDVAQAASGLQDQLGFAPAVPNPGPGWTATSVKAEAGVDGVQTWRVNYATPNGSWVSLIQGREATKKWEGVQVIDGAEQGTAAVDGRTFVVRARPDRQLTGYVLRGDVTTMFVGKAGRAEIEALVRATPLG